MPFRPARHDPDVIRLTDDILLPDHEIGFYAIRAAGPGGQHVNKVSSAVHLRFDIGASSLPDEIKQALLASHDRRISRNGIVHIKAQSFRSQARNRAEALQRLAKMIERAAYRPRRRMPTQPKRAARLRRLRHKRHLADKKALRRKPRYDD